MMAQTIKLTPPAPAQPGKAPIPFRVDRGHVRIEHVSVHFGAERQAAALAEATLDVKPGEFVCLLGPSGCGKSTLLNVVAGFIQPSSGRVTLDGIVVRGPGPDRGMVFQQYSLLPWKNVRDNVAFGPSLAGKSRREAQRIANGYLASVGLAHCAERYPAELSGGMQQRVGIARALAGSPSVLLMDEPFGSLDAQTRLMMQEGLLRIWSACGITVLFVTHDIDEAIFLADRVLIMSAGPGRILADLPVPLPRPRPIEVATEPAFIRLKRQCLERIRAESLRAFEQQDR
jgi:NitT/TauT family transport system ATP-binding protein